MKPRILLLIVLLATVFVSLDCGTDPNCPTCGTTKNDGYALITTIVVPEHNPTGAPGGPFNSFDISFIDPANHRDYVSDRIGLDVAVFDTINNVALNAIGGANSVAQAGNNASACVPTVPPLVSALGNFTRFGCRTLTFGIPGFGANGLFGGFTGAQCCASRGNGVNPLSCPCGIVVTPDGNTMFVGNASSTVVVFDLKGASVSNPPQVIAVVPTGQSPDWDGPAGVGPCIVSAAGRALSDPTCGDLRADEMAFDPKDNILLVSNGDPGFPFVTLIDVSAIVARSGVGKWTGSDPNCLPVNPTAPYGPGNFPTCVMGQIYYDGAPANNTGVAVDDQSAAGFPCPDASTSAPSGVSGTGKGLGGRDVPCHHGPVTATENGKAVAIGGAVALAGIGGSEFNPTTGHFLVSNGNATADLTLGTIDEIDPRPGNPNGPVVVNSFIVRNCMPTSVVHGPGNNYLVGCADHDGVAFPPNEYVIDGASGNILATIDKVGGVDEVWFNPGDNRYYLAARDMPNGPVLGIVDAGSNQWLQNVTTNANSHSVAADPSNNHVFVPMQSGGICGSQSSNGCVGVFARQ